MSISLLLTVAVAGAHAAPERFTIEAQYRGMVTKSFPRIGSATMDAVETAPGVMRLTASGQATHPQDAAVKYRTAVDLSVKVGPGTLATLKSSDNTAPGSEAFARQIKQVMPILAAVRAQPALTSCAAATIQTSEGPVAIATHRTGSSVEVTAQRGQVFVGKFFLNAVANGLQLMRFRVPSPMPNVMLTFQVEGAPTDSSVD